MKQTDWIISELQRGPVTAIDALEGCGCFRLAARINELRKEGHKIETEHRPLPNGKVIAAYHLKETAPC